MAIRSAISISASAEYAVPVASVEYVELAVSAFLDTTGKYKVLLDLTVMADGLVFDTTKPLADLITPPDAISVAALKTLADGFAMNDGSEAVDGSVYSFAKGISNVVSAPDAAAVSAAKSLTDTIASVDLVAKSLSRPVADVFDLADAETVSALKGLSDSFSPTDSVATLLLFIRNFSNSASVADTQAILFALANRTETIYVADEDVIGYQKNLADGFAMNDDSEAVDGSVYVFAKGISNVAFVAEESSFSFATSRVESTTAVDAGVVSVQNYCDLTYFLEDYVGTSRVF
jgi:hypothetical protein